jgi:hypothetical protein
VARAGRLGRPSPTSERSGEAFAPLRVGNRPGEAPAILRELDERGLVDRLGRTHPVYTLTSTGEQVAVDLGATS